MKRHITSCVEEWQGSFLQNPGPTLQPCWANRLAAQFCTLKLGIPTLPGWFHFKWLLHRLFTQYHVMIICLISDMYVNMIICAYMHLIYKYKIYIFVYIQIVLAFVCSCAKIYAVCYWSLPSFAIVGSRMRLELWHSWLHNPPIGACSGTVVWWNHKS